MTDTCGLTHLIIGPGTPEDPFVLHLTGIRENGDNVLVATVDDDFPLLAARILRVIRSRGITIEGADVLFVHGLAEPDLAFLTMRSSIHEDDVEWTDLECRFRDGQKMAAASFALEFETFARGMYELHPMPDQQATGEEPKRGV